MFKAENKDCFILIKILSNKINIKRMYLNVLKIFNNIGHLITGIFHLMNCRYHSIIININLHQFFKTGFVVVEVEIGYGLFDQSPIVGRLGCF